MERGLAAYSPPRPAILPGILGLLLAESVSSRSIAAAPSAAMGR